MGSQETPELTVFQTALGWMACLHCRRRLGQLTFGYSSAERAIAALDPALAAVARRGNWPELARRLRNYADGEWDDFRDIEVDTGRLTAFGKRVVARCRAIPPGSTRAYADLATEAGHPGAARAVGTCMARNRVPIVVPCHRVVGRGGSLGGYSGCGGVRTKRRLLELEGHLHKLG